MLDTNGASMLDISERFGHCHMKTTKRYLHNNPALRARTRNIVENLYVTKNNYNEYSIIKNSKFSNNGLVYVEIELGEKTYS